MTKSVSFIASDIEKPSVTELIMITFVIAFVASFLIIFSLYSTESADNLIVKLPNGLIKGRLAHTGNRPFWAFQKIPYATPPLGELRFKPPLPAENWDGVLDTTENNVVCYQVPSDSELESEDCLYVNVYTPRNPSSALPVIFYIYGGGFIEGNSLDHIYGPEYLLDHDVVIVVPNYRVGPFGFLSTGDMVVPGNNGLKDQLLALEWSHKNIHLFGGDPHKIVLMGQSAGSASVTYHLLHTQSKGLFRGAICESGSFLCPWAYQRRPRSYALQVATLLNPNFDTNSSSQHLVDFLQTVDARELDNATYQLSLTENHQNRQLFQGFFWAPVIEAEHDGAFITRKMYGQLKSGDFVKVPTLMGFNSEESVYFAYYEDWIKGAMATYDANLDWLVPDDMKIEDLEERKKIGAQIREIYTGGVPLEEVAVPSVRYYSDNSFTRPIRKHAELQSQYTDVYFYQFSYDGKLGNFPFAVEGAENVTHSEENKYIWRMYDDYYDNSDLNVFPEEDRITQYRIQKIWTDFAKYLHPTPNQSDLLQNREWPKVSSDFAYVDILKDLEVKNDPKNETYTGWVRIYDSLGHDDFDTY